MTLIFNIGFGHLWCSFFSPAPSRCHIGMLCKICHQSWTISPQVQSHTGISSLTRSVAASSLLMGSQTRRSLRMPGFASDWRCVRQGCISRRQRMPWWAVWILVHRPHGNKMWSFLLILVSGELWYLSMLPSDLSGSDNCRYQNSNTLARCGISWLFESFPQ